jgi:tetratricopeptide (TPR) repeat protein
LDEEKSKHAGLGLAFLHSLLKLNLTRWGGALLELAHFRQGQDSIDMVQDAVAKLEEALRINPRKHDALWCLGNAHTSQGFLVTETYKANAYFKKAARCFRRALDEDPNNELYQKALEMTEKVFFTNSLHTTVTVVKRLYSF